MILYQLAEKPAEGFGLEKKASFGIECRTVENGEAVLLDAIEDIASSRQSVAALAQRCTQAQLSPLHFRDVVADFLLR